MLAIVPVKAFHLAKQRLAGALSTPQRAALSQAMTRDVINALSRTPAVTRIVICAGDRDARALADAAGVEFVWERDLGTTGLNQSVAALADSLHADGVDSLLVVHSDIPGLQPADVGQAIIELDRCDVVITPDQYGLGSNMLGWHLDCDFRPRYGHQSFFRHIAQAVHKQLRFRVCHLPSPCLDIDNPKDLQTFAALDHAARTATGAFLRKQGLTETGTTTVAKTIYRDISHHADIQS